MNLNIATQHKTLLEAQILKAGETVTIRLPVAREAASNNVDKVFGASGYETDTGVEIEIIAWVHQGNVPTDAHAGPTQQGAAHVGMLAESDIILSCKLDDALVDTTKKYGRTQFDNARDVVVSGSRFEVKGTFRSGFAPLGPYILWVGLVNAGE